MTNTIKINHRRLGKSELQISEVGLGCWQLGGDFGPIDKVTANSVLKAADQNGISFWDTADVYGSGQSEQYIGDWCREHHGTRVIATKLGRNGDLYPNGYSVDNIKRSIYGSLERLQLERISLIQLHCIPVELLKNDTMWQCIDDMKREGVIDNVGASVETIEEAQSCLSIPLVSSLQIIFNIFRQDACDSLLANAKAADVGILARLPLASGLLTGKMSSETTFSESDHRHYNRNGDAFSVGETFSGLPFKKGLELVEDIKPLVPENMTLAQFALRWCLDQDGITSVLAGASSPTQVISNAQAAAFPPLSNATHEALRELYHNKVRPHVRGNI
jgi:aryl-alcohol dehydrogenase-like predicted oxidoreductase